MERTFKCRSCGVTFLADDNEMVKCPHCGSDDIVPVKQSSGTKKTLLIALGAFVVAAGVGVLVKMLRNSATDTESGSGTYVTETTIETANPEVIAPPVEVGDGTTLEVTKDIAPFDCVVDELVPNAATRSYSFNVVAMNLPEGCSAKYQVLDFATRKLVKENKDGIFKGIPAANDADGSYTVKVYALRGDEVVDSAANYVTGCVKFPEVAQTKLSVAEVQALVNKAVAAGSGSVLLKAKGISQSVKISYTDLRGESVSGGVTGMCTAVTMLDLWSGYTVLSVDYDANNLVNHISLKPNWK